MSSDLSTNVGAALSARSAREFRPDQRRLLALRRRDGHDRQADDHDQRQHRRRHARREPDVVEPGQRVGPRFVLSSVGTEYPNRVSGPSTLTVLSNNNYSGATFVGYGGILAIPTIANGGAASPIGTSSSDLTNLLLGYAIGFGGRGDLMLTGTAAAYSTDRGATVRGFYNFGDGGGAIGVQNAGTTLTWNGPITGPGELIKSGAGTLVLTNTANNLPGRNGRRSGAD